LRIIYYLDGTKTRESRDLIVKKKNQGEVRFASAGMLMKGSVFPICGVSHRAATLMPPGQGPSSGGPFFALEFLTGSGASRSALVSDPRISADRTAFQSVFLGVSLRARL
jgi:hypothetical protein